MGILIMPHDQKVIIIVIIYRLVMLLPQTPFFIIYNLIDSTHSISHFYLHWVNRVKRCWCAHERGKEFLMHVMDMSQNEIDTFFVYIRYFTSFCISLSILRRNYFILDYNLAIVRLDSFLKFILHVFIYATNMFTIFDVHWVQKVSLR